MGYINNHSIIVSTQYDRHGIENLHKKASTLFGNLVTEIRETMVNGGFSFAILPDGSKEGWEESDRFDQARRDFWEFFEGFRYEDGSCPFMAIEVAFDEEGLSRVIRTDKKFSNDYTKIIDQNAEFAKAIK